MLTSESHQASVVKAYPTQVLRRVVGLAILGHNSKDHRIGGDGIKKADEWDIRMALAIA
ncbi:hypothetical protein F441_08294 [Phytophthora nicotianae CJ01A1]|uniref:Uncharacterized protein n=2 Tax=Phytophthora nicotianae TaxID=4792 RepID=V9F8T8_PHYNI|nr:hypothetical protein F443_08308 [Phytophthora nicotianae P1569]ETP17285.1 hypothetical protein F441_08294 [Phytophthora nicotianae CJ01A1]